MGDLIFGVKLTADGKQLVGEVKASADALDGLSASTQRAQASAEKLNGASSKLAGQYSGMDAAAKSNGASINRNTDEYAKLDKQLTELLSSIDPVYNRTMKLDSANDLLHRGMKAGLISNAQYTSSLNLIEKQYGKLEEATGRGIFATQAARREIVVIGREVMTGNFSRIPGSMAVLASRADMSAASMAGLAGAIALPVAALAVLGIATGQGSEDLTRMHRALAMTSNFSGQTSGSLRATAETMTRSSRLTIGAANDTVTALAASGKIGAAAFEGVAMLVGRYADATGLDAEKATAAVLKMFDDPAKGAKELNSTMHLLSVAEIDHIETLQRAGKTTEAQVAFMESLNKKLKGQTIELGYVQTAWHLVEAGVSGMWNAVKALAKVREEQSKSFSLNKQYYIDAYEFLRKEEEKLISKLDIVKKISAAEAEAAELNKKKEEVMRLAQANSEIYKRQGLIAEINRLESITLEGGKLQLEQQEALTKKKKELASGMTAMNKAYTETEEKRALGEYSYEVKLIKEKYQLEIDNARGRKNEAALVADLEKRMYYEIGGVSQKLAEARISDEKKLTEATKAGAGQRAAAELSAADKIVAAQDRIYNAKIKAAEQMGALNKASSSSSIMPAFGEDTAKRWALSDIKNAISNGSVQGSGGSLDDAIAKYIEKFGEHPPGFATGGRLSGPGTPTSDSLVIKGSVDEYMVRASSARSVGYDVLDYINERGALPSFAPTSSTQPAQGGGSLTIKDLSLNLTLPGVIDANSLMRAMPQIVGALKQMLRTDSTLLELGASKG